MRGKQIRALMRNIFIMLLVSVVMVLVGGINHALAQTQNVTLSPAAPEVHRGDSFTLSASYDVSDGDNTLTGLGINIHFNSSMLAFTGFSDVLQTGLFQTEETPQDDTDNKDGDANTDKYVIISWTSFTGNWPNATLPLELAKAGFTALTTATFGTTPVNISFAGTATGYTGQATNAVVTVSQLPAPTIVSVSPDKGTVDGGTAVTITGTNFVDGATVTFAGTPATNVTVVSATQITCTTPAHAAGFVNVVVTNPDTQAATKTNGYEYVVFSITSPTLPVYVAAAGSETFTAVGATSYAWEFSAGSPTTATGESVTWTAPSTPQDVTVTVTGDGTMTDSGQIHVYGPFGIKDKPVEPPVIQAGVSATYQLEGGIDISYAWTVTGPAGYSDTGTGASYKFTAPSTGAFAGVYTITAGDGVATDSFTVKVPMKVDPSAKVMLENAAAQTLTVTGAPAATTFTVTQYDLSGNDVTGTEGYGTFTVNGGSPVETFTYTPDDIDAIKSFKVKFTATDASDLIAAGLDSVTSGIYRVIPIDTYTVTVTSGGVPLTATVAVNYPVEWSSATDTDADGKVTFSLPATGGTYKYSVTAAGYFDQIVTSASKNVAVSLVEKSTDPTDWITGTVEDTGGTALVGATVFAYQTFETQYQATTGAAGAYTIVLPVGAPQTGWTVVATMAGYEPKVLENQSIGTVDFTGTDGLVATTVADSGDQTVAAESGTITVTGGQETTLDLTYKGQEVKVEVPIAGVTKPATIVVKQVAKTVDTDATKGSPTYVYEITAESADPAYTLTAGDINRIVITLPIDLSVVGPGDLESGKYVIYHADTLAILEAGNGSTVPTTHIISTNYVGDGQTGSVTFWVSSLSVFGVGTPPTAAAEGGGGVSGCFINTAGHGSVFDGPVGVVGRFGEWFRSILR